jgi:hypothetical protein
VVLARHDLVFQEYDRRSLALEVVQLLCWTSADAFAAELLSLQT